MKFRQAKKIIEGKSNLDKRFKELRKPYKDDLGRIVFPSWHDIDIVRRAMKVYKKHTRRQND